MAKLGLSSPWVILYREISAMFQEDPEVRVLLDEDSHDIKVFVDDAQKASALDQLLPKEQTFGSITTLIEVIPSNGCATVYSDLYEAAFKKNPAVAFIDTVSGILSNPLTFVVFKKKVVQYYTDDLGDYFGLHSTLYEDLARSVFPEKEGIFFCTDRDDPDQEITSVPYWP